MASTVSFTNLSSRYIELGIAVAGSLVMSGVILQYTRRFRDMPNYFRTNFVAFKQSPKLSLLAAIFYYILIFLPLVNSFIWIVILGVTLGPNPTLPILFVILCIITMFIPVESRFFYPKILILFILFEIAQILAMALSWTLMQSSYFCLTAILLTFNGILVCLAIWLIDGTSWSLPLALPPRLKQQVRKKIHIWKQQNEPPHIIDGGVYHAISSRPITRLIIIISFYIMSLIALLAYTLTVYYRTNYGYLGFINSVCVVSTDIIICMLIFAWKENNTNPFFHCIACIVVRILLISFSGSYWFMGYCLLYIMLMFYLSGIIINKYYPTFQKIPSLQVQKTNILKMPQLSAFLLLMFFSGLIYYLGNENGSQIKVLSVQIRGVVYPFWAIGVASILLSFSLLFYLISLRIVQRSESRIRSISLYYLGCQACSQYYFFLFLSWGVLIILGFYMYVRVGSGIIWASCIFLPIFYQSFVIFYINWAENDYLVLGSIEVFNKKLKKRKERQIKIQLNKQNILKKIKQQGLQMQQQSKINIMDGGQIEDNLLVLNDKVVEYRDWRDQGVITALKQNLMLPTDKNILISIPLMVGSLIGYSLAYYVSNKDHIAFIVSIQILSLFLTIMPMKRYFSTLENPTIPHIIMFIVGIAINYIYGILTIFLKWDTSISWILWWSIIQIFCISVYALFSLLRDKGISTPTIIAGCLSGVLSFGIGIILIAGFKQISSGIVLLGVAFYYTYGIVVYFIYLKMNKSMPWIIIPITIGMIICTCFAVMIYSFVVDSFNDFYGFSITYLAINLIILLYGGSRLAGDIMSKYEAPNFYSPYGTPVFKYDPNIKSVKQNLTPLYIWIGGWIMFYGYTLLMQIFIQDVNYGISTSQIFLIVSFLTFSWLSTYNSYRAGKIKKDITLQMLVDYWKQIEEITSNVIGQSPGVNDLQEKIQKYRQKQKQGGKKVNPEGTQAQIAPAQPIEDIGVIITDLQMKQSKAKENQCIHLVNYWIRIVFKCQTAQKNKMMKFLAFIKESEQLLASLGVSIILDNQLYDLELIYNHAFQQYNMLSPFQKMRFDRYFKQWTLKKADDDKKNDQLNNKEIEAQKKREEDLRKRFSDDKIDDSNLPIEKMKDSPLKLKKIAQTLKNQPYSDSSFKGNLQIIPPYAKADCKGWKRPPPEAVIIKGQDSAMNVKQGYLGDCFLISAIGVLRRHHLENILGINVWQNPNGSFMVKFKKFGKEIFIIIDSEFPVGPDGNWLFGKCQNSQQLFTNIIEKAYAKLYGGYQNIIGGKVSIALSEMTGGFPEEIKLKDYQEQNSAEIFKKMIEFKKSGYLMGAGSPENPRGDSAEVDGIAQGHAYLIIDVRDLDGNQLIKLRNPHGNDGIQSRLDWSDESSKWNKRLLNLLGEQMKQDGAFWIGLNDFVTAFRSLYVCRIFDPALWITRGPIAGEWKGKSAAGLPNKKNPEAKLANNPHYGIKVNRASTLFVQLTQNQLSPQRMGKNYIFFMVQRLNGKRTETFAMNNLVGKSGPPINAISISAEVILNATSYPYTFSIMVSTLDEGAEGSYNLTFNCDDLNMEVIMNEDF